MFSKPKVDSNPGRWQPLFCPVYVLARPLAADQHFDKWKEKITPGIYLIISLIYASTVNLVPSLSTGGGVLLQFHVSFDISFTTINVRDGNIVPPRYW